MVGLSLIMTFVDDQKNIEFMSLKAAKVCEIQSDEGQTKAWITSHLTTTSFPSSSLLPAPHQGSVLISVATGVGEGAPLFQYYHDL